MARNDEIGLAEAAMLMGVSWARAWSALLRGELEGRKDGARWKVSRASAEAWRRSAGAPAKVTA